MPDEFEQLVPSPFNNSGEFVPPTPGLIGRGLSVTIPGASGIKTLGELFPDMTYGYKISVQQTAGGTLRISGGILPYAYSQDFTYMSLGTIANQLGFAPNTGLGDNGLQTPNIVDATSLGFGSRALQWNPTIATGFDYLGPVPIDNPVESGRWWRMSCDVLVSLAGTIGNSSPRILFCDSTGLVLQLALQFNIADPGNSVTVITPSGAFNAPSPAGTKLHSVVTMDNLLNIVAWELNGVSVPIIGATMTALPTHFAITDGAPTGADDFAGFITVDEIKVYNLPALGQGYTLPFGASYVFDNASNAVPLSEVSLMTDGINDVTVEVYVLGY